MLPFNGDYAYWELRDKITFDGVRKEILVNYGETSLNIRDELYASWLQWMEVDDNTKFAFAMRYSGMDPIPGGETGGTFFLINGWKLLYDPSVVAVTGVLYSEDYDTAFYTYDLAPVYPATVASLVNSAVSYQNVVTGTALTAEQTASAVWGAATRTLTDLGMTPEQIATAVLAQIMSNVLPANVQQVNGVTLAGAGVPGNAWRPA